MNNYFQKIEEAAAFLKQKTSSRPKLLLVLTGGLKSFLQNIASPQTFKSADIPHFPEAKVEGHSCELIFGQLGQLPVAIMKGRNHYYEGLSPQEVVFPYFVLAKLGANTLVTTNAVGGVRTNLKSGDILIVNDHINMMGTNPLIGISVLKSQNQFTSMQNAYDPELIRLSLQTAKSLKISVTQGVYLATPGPSYETPAEIKAFRKLGADSVGMSTVFEVITARYLGMRVLTLNIIANPSADRHKGIMKHKEVLASVQKAETKMARFLDGVLRGIAKIA